MLLGYLGALAVGAALALLVIGRAARHTVGPGAAALGELAPVDGPVDLHQARLRQGLAQRLGRPVVARLSALGRRLTPNRHARGVRQRLDSAGLTLPVEAFLAAKAASTGAGLLAGTAWAVIAGPGGLAAAILPAVAGFLAPDLLVRSRARKRQEAISRALPEGLDLLALTVRAGLGFEQALAEVTREVEGPLAAELDRVLKEQQLGRSRREALEALQHRNDCEDLRALTSALLQAERLGTPVADTLSVQARELRRRRRADARERAGKAPVKLLFPLIFGIFPAMFVVIIGPGALRIMEALID